VKGGKVPGGKKLSHVTSRRKKDKAKKKQKAWQKMRNGLGNLGGKAQKQRSISNPSLGRQARRDPAEKGFW